MFRVDNYRLENIPRFKRFPTCESVFGVSQIAKSLLKVLVLTHRRVPVRRKQSTRPISAADSHRPT
jgi:hypothetical protein